MSWLSEFLGFDSLIESKNDLINDLRIEVENHLDTIKHKDQEIRRLTDLMLTEHGVINEDNLRPAQSETKDQPVEINAKFSWPKKQRELERKDREMAKSRSEEIAKYWEAKNAQAEKEVEELLK